MNQDTAPPKGSYLAQLEPASIFGLTFGENNHNYDRLYASNMDSRAMVIRRQSHVRDEEDESRGHNDQ